MKTKKEQRTWAALGYGSWVPTLVMWGAEQAFSSQPWWPRLPWGTITGALLLFASGFFLRDKLSFHPWLNYLLNWSEVGFRTTAYFVDFIEEETRWFVPTVHMKFLQDVEDGHISIRVYDDEGESFVIDERKDIPHRKGDISKVQLCWIRQPTPGDPAKHSIWGPKPGEVELKFSNRSVIVGRKYWVRVAYSWGEKNTVTDTFFLEVRSRPNRAGGGVDVVFGLVTDFVPTELK